MFSWALSRLQNDEASWRPHVHDVSFFSSLFFCLFFSRALFICRHLFMCPLFASEEEKEEEEKKDELCITRHHSSFNWKRILILVPSELRHVLCVFKEWSTLTTWHDSCMHCMRHKETRESQQPDVPSREWSVKKRERERGKERESKVQRSVVK